MKIIAQFTAWNSADVISLAILAVHKFVDEIRVFDGAYAHMKTLGYESPHSTDGTKEIVMALAPKLACPIKWFDCQDFWSMELSKYNFMLKQLKPDDWELFLATDDIVIGNLQEAFRRVKEEKKALVGYIPVYELRFEDVDWINIQANKNPDFVSLLSKKPYIFRIDDKARFIKWQEGLYHEGAHIWLFNNQRIEHRQWKSILLDEIKIIHLKWLRGCSNKEMVKAINDYENSPEIKYKGQE